MVTDACYTVWDRYALKALAPIKRASSDRFYRIGDVYAAQAFAPTERGVADNLDGTGDCDAFNAAVLKRAGIDADCAFFYVRRVGAVSCVYIGTLSDL